MVVRDSNNRLLVMNLESKWLDAVTGQIVPNPKFSSMSLNMMTDQEIVEYVDWGGE